MICSLAALVAAVPAFAQQPYGAGARSRPVSTFATPYPSTPTPGPVQPYVEQQVATARPNIVPTQQASAPRPGGAAAPGAAGNVMYFHKPAGALIPDGMVDPGAIAMARNADVPAVVKGVPDVPVPTPSALPTTPVPTTVLEKPVAEPRLELVVPPQPFNSAPVPALPSQPTAAMPIPPRVVPVPTIPGIKEPGPEVTQLPPYRQITQMYDDAVLTQEIYKSIAKQINQTPAELQKRYPFPTLKPTVPPGTQYVAKTVHLPPSKVEFEAGFVIHHRLHFEEKNSERYGWDLGFIQPFVSTAAFYKNVLMWPHNLASSLATGTMDTNAGKCLPGSATPYYLYPQGLTISGGVAEGLVITGLSFVIP